VVRSPNPGTTPVCFNPNRLPSFDDRLLEYVRKRQRGKAACMQSPRAPEDQTMDRSGPYLVGANAGYTGRTTHGFPASHTCCARRPELAARYHRLWASGYGSCCGDTAKAMNHSTNGVAAGDNVYLTGTINTAMQSGLPRPLAELRRS
jgi:hypothetical protein